jgi:hypothetical protein
VGVVRSRRQTNVEPVGGLGKPLERVVSFHAYARYGKGKATYYNTGHDRIRQPQTDIEGKKGLLAL